MTIPPRRAAGTSGFGERLDALVDRAPGLTDLFFHRLGAAAAARRRRLGLPLEQPLREEQRFAAMVLAATPMVLERIAEAWPHELMILKGPEIAHRYPDPMVRPHHDIDVLVRDAPAAHRALLAAGFEVGWDRPSPHHEVPLLLPELPLVVEVHSMPKWPAGLTAPAVPGLFERARPSSVMKIGLALPPAEHAVVVAAHAWAERPLQRVMDLVDVAVLLAAADRHEASSVAEEWGVGRLWSATLAAADGLLGRNAEPWTLRTWARTTAAVREPSRLEALGARIAAPFAALPLRDAWRAAARALADAPRHPRGITHGAPRASLEHPALNPDVVDGVLRDQYSSSVPRRRP